MRKLDLTTVDKGKWNVNIHYHQTVLNNLPERRSRAIDVGCGEGILTRQLAAEFDNITGVDLDADSIKLAKKLTEGSYIEYKQGDFMEMSHGAREYDLVTSVVTIHHMDAEMCLEQMKKITKDGGIIVIVGVGRSNHPLDLPRLAFASVLNKLYSLTRDIYKHSAPVVWPPPLTNKEMKKLVQNILPGCEFKVRLLNRYTVVWRNSEEG